MKLRPSNRDEWLKAFAFPLKAFVFSYAVVIPLWVNSAPGTPGTKGGPDWDLLENLGIGYAVTFIALLVIAAAQFGSNRRSAVWNIVFALAAFMFAYTGLFHPLLR